MDAYRAPHRSGSGVGVTIVGSEEFRDAEGVKEVSRQNPGPEGAFAARFPCSPGQRPALDMLNGFGVRRRRRVSLADIETPFAFARFRKGCALRNEGGGATCHDSTAHKRQAAPAKRMFVVQSRRRPRIPMPLRGGPSTSPFALRLREVSGKESRPENCNVQARLREAHAFGRERLVQRGVMRAER